MKIIVMGISISACVVLRWRAANEANGEIEGSKAVGLAIHMTASELLPIDTATRESTAVQALTERCATCLHSRSSKAISRA